MKISPFWWEFAGMYLVLLAVLIAVIAAIRLRRADRIRRFGAACSAAFQITGGALLLAWLLQSDWLFWHRQGPPGFLFSGLACSSLGLAAILAMWPPAAAWHDAKRRILWALPIVLAIPSAVIIYIGAGRLSTALQDVRLRHVGALGNQGVAAIPQLVSALGDSNPYVQSSACYCLASLGPAAKDAVPALVYLLEGSLADSGSRSAAMTALGRIGSASEPAIPVLARFTKLGETSWYERRMIEATLRDIGPKARPAMENVVRFHQALAAEELPAKIAAAQSAGPEDIAQAAESLQSMGAYALPALPALRARLAEITREKRYDQLAGIRLKSAVESIASAGRQSERK